MKVRLQISFLKVVSRNSLKLNHYLSYYEGKEESSWPSSEKRFVTFLSGLPFYFWKLGEKSSSHLNQLLFAPKRSPAKLFLNFGYKWYSEEVKFGGKRGSSNKFLNFTIAKTPI